MARPSRDTVEVPRAWLVLLAGGLVVALLLVAYLVGRESGRRGAPAAPVATPAESASEYDDYEGYQDFEDDPGEVSDLGEAPAALPSAVEPAPAYDPWPAQEAPAPASPEGHPQAAAVVAYFAELESYERGAKYWNNPQELAMRLVGQGAQGDTSGFRQLVETQRTARRQIEGMTVPSPCQEHHRRTLDVMGQALELLEGLERGVASGNLEGLLSLTDESRTLETDAREVDALATELKREYGG